MPYLDIDRIRTVLPVRIGELCLCDLGCEQVAAGYSYGPAVRNYTLVHFVLGGKGKFYENGNTHSVHTGECFKIRPDTVTTYTADNECPWEYLWIGMRGAQAEALIEKAFGGRACAPFDVGVINGFDFEQIREEPPYALGLRITGLMFELLASIYRTSEMREIPQPDVVRDAVRYIENNYFHPFDVSTLAHTLGVSRAHFSVVFSKTVGKSPYKYLLDYRLDKAKELLRRTPPLSVEEIAFSVGFSSIERFSEMFKKRFDMSPRAFRSSDSPT